ncbi:MAG TPA: hypothetical protein PK114_10170 [Smithellaceae bacterium]|nr:hypothetical protein [Smithellaceae bacterium]
MLTIHCPICKNDFVWSDDMPVTGKCPNVNCEWNYNVHVALKQNIDRHTNVAEDKTLRCPSCKEAISSRFTICRHCNNIVLGRQFFRKSYIFVAVCGILIVLSLIFKYLVK